ncbi:transcription elongation factor B polypeptide 3-like isoform X2 [Maniola hyperantus]|uniref:transcription elongation factor B polypeptide 3-like isoform X2 n=1 Tax=Aphantopus hyperantus TaxID=2795564 RepID=UPI00212B9F16
MASILDLVRHYQHCIEKYPNDEQKVLKCIDKLYNLGVTVQHLQETGVGRTVNALRKEPGDVGQAARALVYKWKVMVAAEESDQEGEHNNETSNYNGHEHGRDYDNNPSESRNRHDKPEKYDKTPKIEEKHYKQSNGDHSGSKRKYHSSEEEDPDTKKSKYTSSKDNGYIKPEVKVKVEPSDSELDSQDDTSSESDSDASQSSEEERKNDVKVKIEKVENTDKHESTASKQSSRGSHDTHKYESSSESVKEHYRHNTSETSHSSEKSSKDKSNNSQSYKSSKEGDRSIVKKEKEHKSDKGKSHREESSDRHRSSKDSEKQKSSSSSEKPKSNGSSEKHISGSSPEKHKHSSSSEKHRSDGSNAEKHKSSSSSEKHKPSSSEKHRTYSEKGSSSSEKHNSSKSDKDKHKSSSEKEISSDKHKSKETSSSSSSKDKHSSSSKEKSKDKHSSSREKESSHKSDKKHSSSKEVDKKNCDSKRKSDSGYDDASSKKNKHKSSSSSSKSSSSKSKDEIPKKQSKINGETNDGGIDCGSGASFAEALGMLSPAKPKKKSFTRESTQSPNSCSEDLSPAALLAPSTKLAPLPALEISALPEISPHYRPRPPPKFLPHFTDEDAMSCVISSKNQRTKVYSGNKVIGKIPTLYEMCVNVLQEHIDALEYTGGVPYEILKPVVDRATPQQLFVLEHYNPYLMEDTDHLWQKFCEKNFRTKKRQEFETWREMYMRCQEEQEIRLKSLTNNIRIAQEAKKAPIKQTKMAYVDSVVKPPRNILKKQGSVSPENEEPSDRMSVSCL